MRFAVVLALFVVLTHARVLVLPLGSLRREDGRPPSLMDALEGMLGGFPVHPTTHFARNADGDLVVTIPLPKNSQKETKEQTLSAVLRNDGRSLLVRAAIHGAGGSQQVHTMVGLRVKAVKVKSSNFDKSGNARVVLKPADDADVQAFHLESKADAAEALPDAEDAEEVIHVTKEDKGPSTWALWQAALFGAFAAFAGLAFIQYRRQLAKRSELGPGERDMNAPLTQVLSQRAANSSDDIVLLDVRKKTEPPRKKSDEKVS